MGDIPADPANLRVDSTLGEERPLIQSDDRDLARLRARWEEREAAPVLLEQRDAGADASFGPFNVRQLLRGEQSGGRFAVHSFVVPAGASMPAHYLNDTHTYLLVQAGDVEVQVGKASDRLPAHSFGYAPPQTRIAWANTGPDAATVTVIHSPAGVDRGYADAHTAASDGWQASLEAFGHHFDDAELANDELTNLEVPDVEFEWTGEPGQLEQLRDAMMQRRALPRLTVTTPEEMDAVGAGVTQRKQLLRGDESGGQAMLNLLSGLPGFGAPPHHQPTEDELFFIQGGELHMICAIGEADLPAGAFAYCPRNCTHGFGNQTAVETRFVTLNSPAGHERTMAAVRVEKIKGASQDELHALSAAGGFVFHSTKDL